MLNVSPSRDPSHRRDDRHDVGLTEEIEDRTVHIHRTADKAVVERAFNGGFGIALRLPTQRFRVKQSGVLARQSNRAAARLVDVGHDLLVDAARQHHLDHLGRLAVGHAEAVHERGLDLQPLQHRPDLRAAPVDHHRMNAHLLQEYDVAGERGPEGPDPPSPPRRT